MKYFLSTAGKKCCKGCTWLLSLARKEEGYDLIQFKRGTSNHKNLMKLYPGEPAVILDTGEFYVGDAGGNPILINPDARTLKEFTEADVNAIIAHALIPISDIT